MTHCCSTLDLVWIQNCIKFTEMCGHTFRLLPLVLCGRQVAEYEKQRRLLSLNQWNINLENEHLPVNFGQEQLSLLCCIHIHLFFLCCLYNLTIKFRLLPKPSVTNNTSLLSSLTCVCLMLFIFTYLNTSLPAVIHESLNTC
jgi:hypothetical protein